MAGDAAGTGPGEAAYARASALDRDGRELEAIDAYREALELGLEPESEYGARLGLASSLRETGGAAEAVQLHRELAARWPRRRANRMFLALALLEAGSPREALAEAILTALEAGGPDDDLTGYGRALRGYAEDLRPGG